MRTKMLAAFLAVILVLLGVMNSYPLILSRQMIFNSKEQAIRSQASLISTALAGLESFTAESISQAMSLLDLSSLGRIIITDAYGNWLYEAVDGSLQPQYSTIQWCIQGALQGNDCVWPRLKSGVFYTNVSMPVMPDKEVTGAVYLFEADEDQGAILMSLRSTLARISVAVSLAALFLSAFLSETITRRMRQVLEAINQVRSGEYSYRIKVRGRDEVSQLGNEFNSLAERLQQTEEVRRRFVSDASHELKTPLAAIRLLSDSILQNPDIDGDTAREFVSDIGAESERLARTTDKLLRLTRLDNKVEGERSAVSMSQVVDSAMRILRPLAEAQGISLTYLDRGDGCIWANADEIYQVVFNLAENAIKYNVKGGSVELLSQREGKMILLSVRDTGIGIPDADLPHIFERFYRVDKARSREAGGSGLGLSIVRDLVQEYGGEIEACRRAEGGMEFKVRFPIYDGG